MSFLHLSLLAGLGVITLPLMLHLLGRSQPQLIDFPALRFVRETSQQQSTAWQLRHFLLLLLRILLLAALAFALARPRVHSTLLDGVVGASALGLCAALATLVTAVAWISGRPRSIWLTAAVLGAFLWMASVFWGVQTLRGGPAVPTASQSAPVAAAIVIDNGPTMEYRADNQTRLEAGKEMARWILDQLPVASRVGILSGVPTASLSLDPASAKSQLKVIDTQGRRVELVSRIRAALDLVLASDLERKEIYVITDLMAPAWNAATDDLQSALDEHRDEVLLQLIDVGKEAYTNVALGDPLPDFQSVPTGGEVNIDIEVRASDLENAETLTVELWREQIDPRFPVIGDGKLQLSPSVVVDRQVVEISGGNTTLVHLVARDLEAGTHNLMIHLDRPDPLMIDNRRYLSVVAQPQQPTLIVADDFAVGRSLRAMVDPRAISEIEGAETLVDQVNYTRLSAVDLNDYAVICLYNPPPITQSLASIIDDHVRAGGGLLTILGPALGSLADVEGNPLQRLLPGVLGPIAARPSDGPTIYPVPVALTNPVFFALGESVDDVLWNEFPVYRNWTFDSLGEGSQTLMELSDGSAPLLVSQTRGRGETLTLTTPIPEVDSREREIWNLLWASDPIPAFAVLYGSFRALSGLERDNLNYQTGEMVALSNDPLQWPGRYDLYMPDAQLRRLSADQEVLRIGNFESAGTYRLRGQLDQPVVRAFSVNVPAENTQLLRAETADLDLRLGAGNYQVARQRSEVESSVGQARFGRELYPMLMVFVAGLFLAEQAMSNRFYNIKLGRS